MEDDFPSCSGADSSSDSDLDMEPLDPLAAIQYRFDHGEGLEALDLAAEVCRRDHNMIRRVLGVLGAEPKEPCPEAEKCGHLSCRLWGIRNGNPVGPPFD
jgi:hypothetical protein